MKQILLASLIAAVALAPALAAAQAGGAGSGSGGSGGAAGSSGSSGPAGSSTPAAPGLRRDPGSGSTSTGTGTAGPGATDSGASSTGGGSVSSPSTGSGPAPSASPSSGRLDIGVQEQGRLRERRRQVALVDARSARSVSSPCPGLRSGGIPTRSLTDCTRAPPLDVPTILRQLTVAATSSEAADAGAAGGLRRGVTIGSGSPCPTSGPRHERVRGPWRIGRSSPTARSRNDGRTSTTIWPTPASMAVSCSKHKDLSTKLASGCSPSRPIPCGRSARSRIQRRSTATTSLRDNPATIDPRILLWTCVYKFARHEWVGGSAAWDASPRLADATTVISRISRYHLAEEFCHVRYFEEMFRTFGSIGWPGCRSARSSNECSASFRTCRARS